MTGNARRASYDLRGTTAVVTGAGGDLGSAVALLLLGAGATVLAVDASSDALDALAERTSDSAGRLETHVADVRIASDVAAYAERASSIGGGGIDFLFNNAGIAGRVATIADLSGDDLSAVLDVNVTGVLHGLREVLPRMRPGGAVVNTASTAALAGSPGMGAYVASKHAVLGLTRTAALEAAARGVRVNAICPGPIEGRMMGSIDAQRGDVLHVDVHAGRTYSTPEDVAQVVLFLLGGSAALLTGQAILATNS